MIDDEIAQVLHGAGLKNADYRIFTNAGDDTWCQIEPKAITHGEKARILHKMRNALVAAGFAVPGFVEEEGQEGLTVRR
jgi:hypothetical protein